MRLYFLSLRQRGFAGRIALVVHERVGGDAVVTGGNRVFSR